MSKMLENYMVLPYGDPDHFDSHDEDYDDSWKGDVELREKLFSDTITADNLRDLFGDSYISDCPFLKEQAE